MKRTALLAVAVFLLVAGPANAAPKSVKGVVVAKRAHGMVVVATGRKGLGVTVRAGSRHLRLGDRVSVVGKRLRDGSIRPSRLHVLSHVAKARIRGMVVKRLPHAMRVASGHSVLTIQTKSRILASHHDGQEKGAMGEFEIEFEHGDLVEHGFTAAPASGTVQIEGHLVSVSPLVVSVEGLPIEITVPSGMTLPALTPGEEVELTVQTGAGNVFTLVSIQSGDNENENENEVEAKGAVTDSTASSITIDTGDTTLTFAAPAGETLPIVATGTLVEARGVTINGVLTLTRLRTEDGGDGGGGSGDS
jgi:hypothetical protein